MQTGPTTRQCSLLAVRTRHAMEPLVCGQELSQLRLVFVLHSWLDWIPWFGTTVAGATEALNTVESLASAFIVFTFGSLLIVIQIHGRAIHFHHDVCRRHRPTFRYRGAEICGNNRVGTGHRINSGILLLDRLYGTVAAAS